MAKRSFFHSTICHPFFPELFVAPAANPRPRSAAMAGTFGELVWAWFKGARARRAIFVTIGEGLRLSEQERETLWRLFEVPVYALWLSGGEVAGWECEAQNGMHVGWGGAVNCACGRAGAVSRADVLEPEYAELAG